MLENITPRQRKAIEALILSGDISEASRKAGVSRPTMYRWMNERTFQNALQGATAEAINNISRLLVTLANQAVQTLQEGMADKQGIETRIRASNIVLTRLLQIRELYSLEERIKKLEDINDENVNSQVA